MYSSVVEVNVWRICKLLCVDWYRGSNTDQVTRYFITQPMYAILWQIYNNKYVHVVFIAFISQQKFANFVTDVNVQCKCIMVDRYRKVLFLNKNMQYLGYW